VEEDGNIEQKFGPSTDSGLFQNGTRTFDVSRKVPINQWLAITRLLLHKYL
jgi:hypothetical protein